MSCVPSFSSDCFIFDSPTNLAGIQQPSTFRAFDSSQSENCHTDSAARDEGYSVSRYNTIMLLGSGDSDNNAQPQGPLDNTLIQQSNTAKFWPRRACQSRP